MSVRCQAGDTVDVKLWVKSNMASSYPSDVSAATEKELHELAVMQAANRDVFIAFLLVLLLAP